MTAAACPPPAPVAPPARGPLTNLVVHGIGTPPPGAASAERAVWITPQRFGAVMDAIAGLTDVTISFDDGNRSDLERALPALQAQGRRATFFVVADWVGRDGRLGVDDLRELIAAGMRIGSHGLTHCSWRDLDELALERELTRSREQLQALTRTEVTEAACPFGAYDRRVLRALARAGYRRVYTSDGGRARAGAWLQPRNSLRATDEPAVIDRWRHPPPSQRVARAAKRAVKAVR